MKKDWINRNSKIYIKVRDTVNQCDPVGLMRHSPIDEYEPEVIDILNNCMYIWSLEDMQNKLHKIFKEWFSKSGYDKNRVDKLATQLIKGFSE